MYTSIFKSFQDYGLKCNIRYDEYLHQDRDDLHSSHLTPTISRQISDFQPKSDVQAIYEDLDSNSMFKHISHSPQTTPPAVYNTGTFNNKVESSPEQSSSSQSEVSAPNSPKTPPK